MSESFLNGRVVLHAGDSREVLKTLADNSIDSIVTDPPYNLQFMNKSWDTGETAFAVEFWAQCLRVLKPGGHVVAFSGTRTYHRMACAIEDAGFEIRDQLQWVYGSGFPKSHDVSKGIDRAAGVEREIISERPAYGIGGNGCLNGHSEGATAKVTAPATASALQWQGWGTALKPACEPICFGRKPLSEKTVAANVLAHGVGAINVDGCRVAASDKTPFPVGATSPDGSIKTGLHFKPRGDDTNKDGRWPANLIHDGSDEVLAGFPDVKTGGPGITKENHNSSVYVGPASSRDRETIGYDDSGSAARFFYTAKADADDRLGSKHPTVKPVDLMQWLCRLVTPPGGAILDCFAGTGTTGEAAYREGFNCILIEREAEYQADIRRRMALVLSGPDERARESIKARLKDTPRDHGPLFGGLEGMEAAE